MVLSTWSLPMLPCLRLLALGTVDTVLSSVNDSDRPRFVPRGAKFVTGCTSRVAGALGEVVELGATSMFSQFTVFFDLAGTVVFFNLS